MADWRTAARPGAALVTVLATEGSAPRGSGTRMVVTETAATGTIGGGALELRATEQARAILTHPPGSWRVQDYPLGPLLGQCCGGRVRLLIERLGDVDWVAGIESGVVTDLTGDSPVRSHSRDAIPADLLSRGDIGSFREPTDEPRLPLLLFGAGHVGSAIADRLPGLPIHLAWFDSRMELDRPGLVVDSEDALVACAGDAPAGSAVAILTHDHALDYWLAAAALRSNAAFVGLIGSATKRARFVSRLAADGVDSARLTCPIGIGGVTGKEPAVIAVATLAQLLTLDRPC